MPSRFSFPFLLLVAVSASVFTHAQEATISAGVPLRIQIDQRYPVSVGTRIEGHLIAPVYLVDHEILPVNTPVSGSVIAAHPLKRGERADALLDGDFTPLVTPELQFDQITLPDGTIEAISTRATQRDGAVVRMKSSTKKPSLTQQAEEAVRQREQDTLDQITKPGKSDRLLRILYSELPYHPQRIWSGTQYDADLTAPLSIPQKKAPAPLPVLPLSEKSLVGVIEARLTQDLSSATAKQGQTVDAVLTKPLLDATKNHVLLPEGTHLEGVVLQAKPARLLARNGKLRFTFRRLDLPHAPIVNAPAQAPELESQQANTESAANHSIHGRMITSETNRKQNVQIDSEGGAKATGGPEKYVAPLVLGLLASSAGEGDSDNVVKNGVVSNGFGLMARIATMASANKGVAMGFAYYALAKSVYKRWIARGSELTFPKDTRIQIELSER
ncbi:hypothetical protein [Alloacidobacterium sp.]|uniref:hypothetical protein n=1 Tax=Alloacidobacterium sp. TaxID=2951999 RepID=UPI002D75F260|nr:hypothetical protein [Alloacidobacterium sp.]HYK36524.1 hypothetical protein [Alloacidobacterium sp.]